MSTEAGSAGAALDPIVIADAPVPTEIIEVPGPDALLTLQGSVERLQGKVTKQQEHLAAAQAALAEAEAAVAALGG